MPQDAPVEKVATEHDDANAAIDALRAIALDIKELGDENVRLDKLVDELRDRIEGYEESAHGDDAERLESWATLIADHRRGIVFSAELYSKTIDA